MKYIMEEYELHTWKSRITAEIAMHVERHVFRLDRLFKELNNVIEQIVVSETENETKNLF